MVFRKGLNDLLSNQARLFWKTNHQKFWSVTHINSFMQSSSTILQQNEKNAIHSLLCPNNLCSSRSKHRNDRRELVGEVGRCGGCMDQILCIAGARGHGMARETGGWSAHALDVAQSLRRTTPPLSTGSGVLRFTCGSFSNSGESWWGQGTYDREQRWPEAMVGRCKFLRQDFLVLLVGLGGPKIFQSIRSQDVFLLELLKYYRI